MDLVRRGADKLAAGRHHLASRPAGLFRGSRDDWRDADVPKRRKLKKCREIGWYTARLLRLSQLAYLLPVKHHAWQLLVDHSVGADRARVP